MTCYTPLKAFKPPKLSGASQRLTFVKSNETPHSSQKLISVPCGKCIGCRTDKAAEWARRLMHENQFYAEHGLESSFLTLTYNDDHYPENGSLVPKDHELFIRRLRKRFPTTLIRYYGCAEYGSNTKRPHYHYICFGYRPKDLIQSGVNKQGDIQYRSQSLEELWGKGFCTVGDVTLQSCGYVARYVLKKAMGENSEQQYEITDPETGEITKIVPEFSRMSTHPGIGAGWLSKYYSSTFPRDAITVDGKKTRYEVKPPRYYDKLLKRDDRQLYDDLKLKREEKADEVMRRNPQEFTPQRLRTKEEVFRSKIKSLNRKI